MCCPSCCFTAACSTDTETHRLVSPHTHTLERSSSRLNDELLRKPLNIHRLTSLSLLPLLFFFFLLFLLWTHAGSSAHAWQCLAGLQWFWVTEGAAIVIKKPAEGELIEGVLRVLPVWKAECIQSPGAVPAVAPRSWASFFLHWVEVGRVHGVSDLWPVGRWLLPQIAGEVHLREEGVSLDLAGAVGTKTILSRAAKTADDVYRLWAQLHLWRYL